MTKIPRFPTKTYAPFGLLIMFGCAVGLQYSPSFSSSRTHEFMIDEISYSMEVPRGGRERADSVLEIDTASIERDPLFLMVVGYDLLETRTRYHSLTYLMIGLSRVGCCDGREASALEATRSNSFDRTRVVKVNGHTAVYISYFSDRNDYVAQYKASHNSKFNIFLTLRIHNLATKDQEFISDRLDMLERIAASIEIN